MNILCICPIGIGNYLLCYPSFALLKESEPSARLHLLALREGISQLAQGDPLWSAVTCFDPTKLKGDFLRAGGIVAGLRNEKFDASLNFFPSNTWQYHLLPWVAGIRERFGFRYHVAPPSKLSMLCNHAVPVDENLHDVRQNISLVGFFLNKDLGRAQPLFPKLFTEAEGLWALNQFRSISSNEIRIGIHPGSSVEHGMKAKRWHPKKFAELTDRVCGFMSAEAYIFGGSDEESLKREVASAMRCAAHLIAPAPLAKTAALLSRCNLCICNDSGLMHVAACEGIPTVGIFGPTDEKRNGPFGAKTSVIRSRMEGVPVWTARNVGDRSLPKGVDPAESLANLDVDEAWKQLRPWIERTLQTPIALSTEL